MIEKKRVAIEVGRLGDYPGPTLFYERHRKKGKRGVGSQNGWRIVEPINMPYISVTGEIEALRKFDESASARLQARQFTIVEPEEYFRSVRENVRKSLQVLERRK